MSKDLTRLDAAHAAIADDPENDQLRLAFFEALADGEMIVLLAAEPEGDQLSPRIFDLESGPVALVFDQEERLAAFAAGIAPYAAMPGRVLARLLAGQGIGLGVNLGVAPSSMLLPPEALDWLAERLQDTPEELEARATTLFPPAAGAPLLAALRARLAAAAGLAGGAVLAGVAYGDGRRGQILAVIDAAPEVREPLARALNEALVFSGAEEAALDITFLPADAPVLARLRAIGLWLDVPPAPAPRERRIIAPGSDPDRPPKLR